jgi:hypothetical protein
MGEAKLASLVMENASAVQARLNTNVKAVTRIKIESLFLKLMDW